MISKQEFQEENVGQTDGQCPVIQFILSRFIITLHLLMSEICSKTYFIKAHLNI